MPNGQYPTILAGQTLTAALLQSMVPLAAWKTSGASRSVTTQSIDADLQLTLAANATYEIEASLIYAGTAGGGFSFGWTVPSGSGGGLTVTFNLSGTGEVTYGYGWAATPLGGTPAGVTVGAQIRGSLWTSSPGGTFGLNWASGTSGDSISLGAGSFLKARRIA